MPALRRDKSKQKTQKQIHKQRFVMDEATAQPGQASAPRVFQMPPANPEPFTLRRKPEPSPSSGQPLWPGWHTDPTGRHETRYFDGLAWTDHVADGIGKRPSVDAFSA